MNIRLSIAAIKSAAPLADGSIALVALLVDGSEITLVIPGAIKDIAATALVSAVAESPPANDLSLALFQAWEVGCSRMTDRVALIFDKGSVSQRGFASDTRAARAMGRALISQARAIEHDASRRIRQ